MPPHSHKSYVRRVRRKARCYGGLNPGHRDYAVWEKLRQTNLEAAYPLLAPLYSVMGCPARDPVTMLRACLAMMLCGETSFTHWVALLRDEPFYALLCGFDPEDVPGVGTFYDFQDRVLHHVPHTHNHVKAPYRRRPDHAQHPQPRRHPPVRIGRRPAHRQGPLLLPGEDAGLHHAGSSLPLSPPPRGLGIAPMRVLEILLDILYYAFRTVWIIPSALGEYLGVSPLLLVGVGFLILFAGWYFRRNVSLR